MVRASPSPCRWAPSVGQWMKCNGRREACGPSRRPDPAATPTPPPLPRRAGTQLTAAGRGHRLGAGRDGRPHGSDTSAQRPGDRMSWESPRSARDSPAATEKGAIGDCSWPVSDRRAGAERRFLGTFLASLPKKRSECRLAMITVGAAAPRPAPHRRPHGGETCAHRTREPEHAPATLEKPLSDR